MEETISLKEIMSVLKKRWQLIVGFVVGAILLSSIATFFFMTPTYQYSSEFIVNQERNNDQQQAGYDINEIRSSVELINTYNVIIKSPAILEEVNSELDLNLSADQLAEKITVSNAEQSQVVTVAATDESAETAANLANATVKTFEAKIPDLMNVDNVNILSEAEAGINPSPVSPNAPLNLAIAAVVGLMLGVGVALLLEYLDTTVKNTDDLEEEFGMAVLGSISTISPGEASKQERRNTNTRSVASRQRRENVGS
ncbi:capsular biosynthesis protein [Salimicrobium jeotgali]|uniref:Capsular biosynthesis protein n=1 Tax=Salimicrobium jeotgali TaxID=1230341 RepID=K2G7V9_9BACI|nr:Wzz/FepE/Etk N-terminal domain-containing protein [Salimicrobium jeotgali]AKG03768.1 capsular biosynthesis protein [Salimicrobium jeotgali]EKE31248.1 capsular polysaccharide biosynthesis protein, putative chain length regulator [Salimicrobium jeotgali]MBM7697060.1 capsular polysaccharide biosynthesis protein [Salimicrobium jeotgali]